MLKNAYANYAIKHKRKEISARVWTIQRL